MLRLYLAAVSAVVVANVIRASCVPNTQEAIEQTFSAFPQLAGVCLYAAEILSKVTALTGNGHG